MPRTETHCDAGYLADVRRPWGGFYAHEDALTESVARPLARPLTYMCLHQLTPEATKAK